MSNHQRTKSKEQRQATIKRQRAKSKEQRAQSSEHRAKSNEQKSKSRVQRAKTKGHNSENKNTIAYYLTSPYPTTTRTKTTPKIIFPGPHSNTTIAYDLRSPRRKVLIRNTHGEDHRRQREVMPRDRRTHSTFLYSIFGKYLTDKSVIHNTYHFNKQFRV